MKRTPIYLESGKSNDGHVREGEDHTQSNLVVPANKFDERKT